jgi:tetratricopeptide (TPR) repeat protein
MRDPFSPQPHTRITIHTRIRILFAALLALGLHGLLLAAPASDLQALTDAVKLRSDMADNVVKGLETSDAAIGRLRTLDSPSGLKIGGDFDFALAAIDVGLRLIPAGKPVAAGQFFQEAESSLIAALKNTPDAQTRDRAELLKHLAFIRGFYLGNAAQARVDIEQAIALQPDNKHLQEVRNNLARGNAEIFKDQPKG